MLHGNEEASLLMEIEEVLRVLLYHHGSVDVPHIQTQHLLCDCTTKVRQAYRI